MTFKLSPVGCINVSIEKTEQLSRPSSRKSFDELQEDQCGWRGMSKGGNDVRQGWGGLLEPDQRWSSMWGWHTFSVRGPNGKYLGFVGQTAKLKILCV